MCLFSSRVLKEYFMLDYLLQIIPTIADGLKVTIALFCVVWVLSIPGGIILALLRLSKLPVVDKIVEAFVYLMRCLLYTSNQISVYMWVTKLHWKVFLKV